MAQLNIDLRPSKPERMVGYTTERMEQIVKATKTARSILIYGPTGSGKTTLALVLAKQMTVAENIHEVNVGADGGVGEIRKLISMSKKNTLNGKRRVFILDEIHRASREALDALLTPMEDAKGRNTWIFCTNEPERLLAVFTRRVLKIKTPEWTEEDLLKVAKRANKATGAAIPKNVKDFANPSELLTFMELPDAYAAESKKVTSQGAKFVLSAMLGVKPKGKLFDFKYSTIMEISRACRSMMGVTLGWENTDPELVRILQGADPKLVAKIAQACAVALRDDTRPPMVLLDILIGSVALGAHFER